MAPDPGARSRATAAQALLRVVDYAIPISQLGGDHLTPITDSRDRALVMELLRGSARWWHRYEFVLPRLLEHPLKQRDRDIHMLLVIGLHQILTLRVPDHAVVASTVAACDILQKPWAKRLVNGLLRNAIRQRDAIEQSWADSPQARYNHPEWLLAQLHQDWPDAWQRILDANNQQAPMTLRINARLTTRAPFLDRLQSEGIHAEATTFSNVGIRLQQAVDVSQLPGFAAGQVSVQDEAAQLAALILAPTAGARVLDACAAPGGKSAHLLESQPGLSLIAIDVNADRAARLRATRQRLGLDFNIVVADATRPEAWWDGIQFDAILVDAPCTGTGVIRRQPDIKLHRIPSDLDGLCATQQALLAALWPTLRPGGKLLYATCSLLQVENDLRIAQFMEHFSDARVMPLTGPAALCGHTTRYGRQILPGENGMDGFYYACMVKP